MTTPELKPCPFCGAHEPVAQLKNPKQIEIYCTDCPCEMSINENKMQWDEISVDEAAAILVSLWNTRHEVSNERA